jgi:aryl-alcohol dehydrogenase-like predicted oxidoreductase
LSHFSVIILSQCFIVPLECDKKSLSSVTTRNIEEFAALLPPGKSLAQAALQFILAQPQVSTIIPGAKSIAQVLDNFAAAEEALTPETVHATLRFWERDLKDDPLPW